MAHARAAGYADGNVNACRCCSKRVGPAFRRSRAAAPLPANERDFGYGLFLLDDVSRTALLKSIGLVHDDFLRALLWDALWEGVRAADLPPLDFLDLTLREIPRERDEVTVSGMLGRLQTVFRWYLSDAQQAAVAPALETVLRDGMLRPMRACASFGSAAAAMAATREGRDALVQLVSAELAILCDAVLTIARADSAPADAGRFQAGKLLAEQPRRTAASTARPGLCSRCGAAGCRGQARILHRLSDR